MPTIGGKFYTCQEVRAIVGYWERSLWEEAIEGVLIIIEDESDDEGFKRYLHKNWDSLIQTIVLDMPKVFDMMIQYAAADGSTLHNLIEGKIRKQFENRETPEGDVHDIC